MSPDTNRKAMTVRVDTETAEQIEALAQVEGVPVAQVVREALARHIEQRRNDAEFQRRLRASIERNKTILERLSR
jgi:predicted DNA-binding protein